MLHPIAVGRGKRLFEDGGRPRGLKLVDQQTFATGVLSLVDQPSPPKPARPTNNVRGTRVLSLTCHLAG